MFRYKLLAGRHQQKEDVLDLRAGIQRTTGAVLEQTTPAAFEAQVAKDAAARKRVAPGSKTKIEPASRPAAGTRTPTVASGPPRVTATLEGARSGTPSNVLKE